MKNHPLWPVLIGFSLGLALDSFSVPLWAWPPFLAIAWIGRRHGVLAFAFSLVLGTVHAPTDPPVLNEERICIEGSVIKAPRPRIDHRIEKTFDIRSSLGAFRVHAIGPLPPLSPGDEIRICGVIKPFPKPTNPGEFNRRSFHWRNGLAGEIRILDSPLGLKVLQKGSRWNPYAWAYRLRQVLTTRLAENLSPSMASFGAALLLGDRYALESDIIDRFRCTGTYHLLAISGLHLGLILGGIRWLLQILRIRGPLLGAVLALVATLYVGIADFAPSIVRAWGMTLIYSASDFWRRPVRGKDVVPAAALLILLIDSSQIYSLGFQFSMAAVSGIVFLAGPLSRTLSPRKIFEARPGLSLLGTFARALRTTLIVSFAATLSTAPLSLFYFGQFVPIAPFASLLLLPWLSGMLVLLSLGLIVANPLSRIGLNLLDRWLELILRWTDLLPGTPLYESQPSTLALQFFGVALLAFAWSRFRTSLIFVLLSASITLGRDAWRTPESRITVFDVGAGLSVLVQCGDDPSILCLKGAERYDLFNVVDGGMRALRVERLQLIIVLEWSDVVMDCIARLAERWEISEILAPKVTLESSIRLTRFWDATTLPLKPIGSSRVVRRGLVCVDVAPTADFERLWLNLELDRRRILVLAPISGPELHRRIPEFEGSPWDLIVASENPLKRPGLGAFLDSQESDILLLSVEEKSEELGGLRTSGSEGAITISWQGKPRSGD